MKEEILYKPVAEFIKTEFDCFDVDIKKGIDFGKIDVVGIRYVMGDYGGNVETISVEVKLENSTFLKSIGQALGYSVMVDRCYLAMQKKYGHKFNQKEKDIAAQIGVGLIEIGVNRVCNVVVSSPLHRPIRAHKLSLIGKMGYVECVLCGRVFEGKGMRSGRERSSVLNAIREEKPFRYWLEDIEDQFPKDKRKYLYNRRHICIDCVKAFSGLDKEGKRKSIGWRPDWLPAPPTPPDMRFSASGG